MFKGVQDLSWMLTENFIMSRHLSIIFLIMAVTVAQAFDVSQQLRVCENHFNANRLTKGKGGNALACYQNILKKAPNNAAALAGLENIEARYIAWINNALDRKKINKALFYLDRLRQMTPHLSSVEQAPDSETARRLKICKTYLNRLSPSQANTALACYRHILKKNAPGNVQAIAALVAIKGHYVTWIKQALQKRELNKAKQYLARLGKVNLSNLSAMVPEMVRIPAGRFRMGSRDEQPIHWVSIKGFAMSRYEVTFAEYDKFAQATARKKPDDEGWGRGARPVINVSMKDARAYAQWLSQQTGQKYRLPTEAEWEYAARAKTKTLRYWGNDPTQACLYANVWDKSSQEKNTAWHWTAHDCRDGYAYTAPVGRFQANAFGLFDMLGNVWEWVCSEYEESYSGKEQYCVTNDNPDTLYVVRGGSWSVGTKFVRATLRGRDTPEKRSYHVGFRLVRDD